MPLLVLNILLMGITEPVVSGYIQVLILFLQSWLYYATTEILIREYKQLLLLGMIMTAMPQQPLVYQELLIEQIILTNGGTKKSDILFIDRS